MLISSRRWRRRLAVVALVATTALVSAGAALAHWSRSQPVTPVQLHSARIELVADGTHTATFTLNITGQLGVPTTVYRPITLANSGTAELRYRLSNVTHTGAPNDLIGTTVRGRFYDVATAGECTTGVSGQIATTPNVDTLLGVAFTNTVSIPTGGSDVICLALTVPQVQSTAFVGGSDTMTLHLEAKSR